MKILFTIFTIFQLFTITATVKVGGVTQTAQSGDNMNFILRALTSGGVTIIGPIPVGATSYTTPREHPPGQYSVEATGTLGGQFYSGLGGTGSQFITTADITFELNF